MIRAVRVIAILSALAITAVLGIVAGDATSRAPEALDLAGWADPSGLRAHIASEQQESRSFWFVVVPAFHAAEFVILLLFLQRINPLSRRLLGSVFIVTAQLGAYTKLATAGWYVLAPTILFYPLVFIAHIVLGVRAIFFRRESSGWAALASAMLLVGILLQYDIGDGNDWLTLTAMLGDAAGGSLSGAPAWIPEVSISFPAWNVAMFLPTFLCWVVIELKARDQGRQQAAGGTIGADAVGAV